MTCDDFHEHAAALALGALEGPELAACEAHLATGGPHDGCFEALDADRRTVADLASTLAPVPPRPELWSRIEAGLGPVRGRPRPPRAVLAFAALAALLAVVLGALLVRVGSTERERGRLSARVESLSSTLVAAHDRARRSDEARGACENALAGLRAAEALRRDALALLEQPDTRVVPLASPTGGAAKATAIVGAHASRAIVLSTGLVAEADHDYELWVLRGPGAPLPAGLLHALADGTTVGEIDAKLLVEGEPDAFAVSREAAGGSAAPTEVLLVGRLKG